MVYYDMETVLVSSVVNAPLCCSRRDSIGQDEKLARPINGYGVTQEETRPFAH
jgi:hypothetical protein